MKSNCWLYAFSKHANDDAIYIAFRKSRYSKLVGRIPTPIRWLARILLYPVFAAYAILYTLAFETWPHFHCADKPAEGAREFVPIGTKSMRLIPPILFEGVEVDVKD